MNEVFGAELPHYFKYVASGDESTDPKLEFAGKSGDVSQLVMNIPAGTDDWFGGWDGDDPPQPQRYANEDATSGRMVELIERQQPAIMLCHWPGLYSHGTKQGLFDFQKVVTALHNRFSKQTLWMKLSDIGRYWAARKLAKIRVDENRIVSIDAPISCRNFTVRFRMRPNNTPLLRFGQSARQLREVKARDQLAEGTFWADDEQTIVCFELPKGMSRIEC